MDSAARALLCMLGLAAFSIQAHAAAKAKVHAVNFGTVKRVPYSVEGDPAGNNGDEKELKVRPLLVDGKVKEWTTGESHDVTDRSVAVRRALRINDALPGDPADKTEHWVWQRGPWLLIDRTNGHVTALKFPDFDPAVSNVAWFRDYAAYCGLSSGGKQLYAVVAQVAGQKAAADEENLRLGLGRPPRSSLRPSHMATRTAQGDLYANQCRASGEL